MLTSKQVTAEDAVQYDDDPRPVVRLAGALTLDEEGLHVTGANGKRLPLEPGQWVIRYAPGDCGVMDDGEYRRWFGR